MSWQSFKESFKPSEMFWKNSAKTSTVEHFERRRRRAIATAVTAAGIITAGALTGGVGWVAGGIAVGLGAASAVDGFDANNELKRSRKARRARGN